MKTNDVIIELVRKVKKGDNVAFTDLYNETYKYLHTCVIHIVKDEDVAQDMLQDTYVEIYKNIGQIKDDAGFLGWASTIANRKCFAYLKKNKDVLADEQTDDEGNSIDYFENIADDEAFIPENIFDNIEKINIIRGIIDELTDVQRACVIGYYYNEQKQDQIADELGIPVNTVKSHLNRAKSKIKEAVGDIETKQGIKLLSVIPFMVALFGFETKAYAAECVVPEMSASVAGAVATKGTISTGTATVKATGTTVKSAGMALKTKIAIGAVVGALGIGAVAGMTLNKKPKEQEIFVEDTIDNQIDIKADKDDIVKEKVDESNDIKYVNESLSYEKVLDIVSICDMPLSTISRDDLDDYFARKASEYYGGMEHILKEEDSGYYKTWSISKDMFMDEYKDGSSYGYTFENEIMISHNEKGFDDEHGYSEFFALQDDQYNVAWLIYDNGREHLSITDNEVGRGHKSNFNLYTNKANGLSSSEFVDLVYPGASEMFNTGVREIVFENGFMREMGNIYFDDGTDDNRHFNHIVPSYNFNDKGEYLITGVNFECIEDDQLKRLDLRVSKLY